MTWSYPSLPNDVFLQILDMTPLETWYHHGETDISLHMCNLRLVNSLFNKHILRRLKDIHTCPENPQLLVEVALQAASKGNAAFIRFLLDTGMDVDINSSASTLLHAATFNRQAHVVKLLLERGACADHEDYTGCTPIEIATTRRYTEIVELLLTHTYAEAIGCALCHAANADDEEIMQLIWDSEIGLDDFYTTEALGHCCCNGNVAFVRIFLEKGVPVTAYNPEVFYFHCLAGAADNGHAEVVALLLQHGAEVHINAPGSRFGTPLQGSAYTGQLEVVRILLEYGADVNAPPSEFGTALQMAAYAGRDEIVELLLRHGADVHAEGAQFGTAIEAARLKQRNNVIVEMLLDAGA